MNSTNTMSRSMGWSCDPWSDHQVHGPIRNPKIQLKNRDYSTTVNLCSKEFRKINISVHTLEVGANDRSAPELKNFLKNEVHTGFLTEIWPFSDPTILYKKKSHLVSFYNSNMVKKATPKYVCDPLGDVVIARHTIKLIAKSEFWFSMIPPSKSDHNVPPFCSTQLYSSSSVGWSGPDLENRRCAKRSGGLIY